MDRASFEKTEAFMTHCMRDNVHDTLHIYRVLCYALRLAEGRSDLDMDVVVYSALLHDIGRPQQAADPAVCHAEAGSAMALAFLLGLPTDERTARHVAACILTHRHKKGRTPESAEAELLYDADKLDLTGAVGTARAILFGGQIDEPLYLLGDNGLPAPGKKRESPSLLREYNRKLKEMTGLFYTKEARKLAGAQQKSMDCFFKSFEEEVTQNHKEGRQLLDALLAP